MKTPNGGQLGFTILAAGAFALLAGYWLVQDVATRSIAGTSARIAINWAELAQLHVPEIKEAVAGRGLSDDARARLSEIKQVSTVFRYKLFDLEGRLVFVSDRVGMEPDGEDAGGRNAPALQVVRTVRPVISVESDREDPNRPAVYVEAYVPLVSEGQMDGVVEVYVDVTSIRDEVVARSTRFGLSLVAIFLLAMLVPGLLIRMVWQAMQAQNITLAAARDDALAAERLKGQFLANMSHEIRTPMNGVMGVVELLSDTELSPHQRNFVGLISQSANALMSIINDVLEFSRLGAGAIRLDNRPFKPSQVVHETMAMLSKTAGEKGVELLVRIDPELPRGLVGDPDRLRQVLTNLMANAVKFTPAGQVELEMTRGMARGGTEFLRVEVRDTGIGIPEDQLESVFDTFTQVDGSSTRAHEGTGLGLAISRSLVELMGGEIGVTSEFGRGSRFWFTFPLERAHEGAISAPQPPDAFAGLRVLVADDNPTSQLILQETLRSWRMEGIAAGSGEQALEALREAASGGRPVGLVLLDHEMPDMDGLEVLQRLRAEPAVAEMPIILLSSLDMVGRVPGPEAGGPDAVMVKPALRSRLFDRIADCLARPAERQSGSTQSPEPERFARSNAQRVLVVDDNRVNRMIAERLLRKVGIEAHMAENGLEAVAVYRDLRPDLIFMDVSMPGMNGYDATAKIREIEAEDGRERAHIIGLTAHALDDDRRKCLAAGMDAFVSKPITEKRLRAEIAEAGMLSSAAVNGGVKSSQRAA